MNAIVHPMNEQHEAKLKLLREIVESLMWELDSIRHGRWENVPEWIQNKERLLGRLAEFDWSYGEDDAENMEIQMYQGQIRDLEYQLSKVVQSNLDILQAQLTDLSKRKVRWNQVMQSYRS
jgi:predicted RNase H-like nuclease (RuvC/YqgF family)